MKQELYFKTLLTILVSSTPPHPLVTEQNIYKSGVWKSLLLVKGRACATTGDLDPTPLHSSDKKSCFRDASVLAHLPDSLPILFCMGSNLLSFQALCQLRYNDFMTLGLFSISASSLQKSQSSVCDHLIFQTFNVRSSFSGI